MPVGRRWMTSVAEFSDTLHILPHPPTAPDP